MITIKQIQNNATVTDGSDTVTLGAGGSYTCSEPEEKLDFIFTVDTTISDVSPSDSISYYIYGFGEIDWGDGNTEYIYEDGNTIQTHKYNTDGVYDIKLSGSIWIYSFSSSSDNLKVIGIKQWGNALNDFNRSFYNCYNLVTLPPQNETLKIRRLCQNMFEGVTLPYLPKMDFLDCHVSNSSGNAKSAFNASNFDFDASYWNMSAISQMTSMFQNTSMSQANCDAILTGWTRWDSATGTVGLTLKSNVSLHMGNTDYTRGGDAEDAFNYLVNTLNWTIIFG